MLKGRRKKEALKTPPKENTPKFIKANGRLWGVEDYHSYYPEGDLAYRNPKNREVTGVIFKPNQLKSQKELDRLKWIWEQSQKKPTHQELKEYPK